MPSKNMLKLAAWLKQRGADVLTPTNEWERGRLSFRYLTTQESAPPGAIRAPKRVPCSQIVIRAAGGVERACRMMLAVIRGTVGM